MPHAISQERIRRPLISWGDGERNPICQVKIAPAPQQEQGDVEIVKDLIAAGIPSK